MTELTPLDAAALPPGIRSRFLGNGNGLTLHVLESGFTGRTDRPLVLLLHGFPELAYSWRHVMPPLAEAGYHVVAPDQRGYGRTTGWSADYDSDLTPFTLLNLVRDVLGLVAALGRCNVAAVVGHDFGSPVAAACALVRPDVFRSVALMSAPFAGPPPLAAGAAPDGGGAAVELSRGSLQEALAALDPPRQHYQWYYSTRAANRDMHDCPQGVHDFLRAYYHVKSADWRDNRPVPLAGWTAPALAALPRYYIMDQDGDMAATVAPEMPSPAAVAACRWLTDDQLGVYSAAYRRTGFQGGLQWYRCATGGHFASDLKTFAGRTIDVPSCFIAGRSDWGVYQKPGEFEAMRDRACTDMRGCHLVDGAGHWVQQEQPQAVVRILTGFLRDSVSNQESASPDRPLPGGPDR